MHKLKSLCIVTLMSAYTVIHTVINTPINSFKEFKPIYKEHHEKNIDNYLNQLEHDLKMFEKTDQYSIINIIKLALKDKITSPSIKQDIHQIAKNAIISHGENRQRIIAKEFYHNTDKINRIVESQRGNLLAILNKTDYIDGNALAEYFGDRLFNKTKKEALHPENKPYLKAYWFYLLSDTPPTPKPSSFDPNKRHRMYEDYCNAAKSLGFSEESATEMKKIFWDACASCNDESSINACMQQHMIYYLNKY